MSYKAKPAMAAWIQRERKRLGLSTEQLAQRMGAIGAKVSEQTISVWESNASRPPGPYNLDALERIFGTKAPERATEGGADIAALVNALAAQTAAMTELIQELRQAREMSLDVRERVAAVEAYAEEHELRFRADPARRGVDIPAADPTRFRESAGTR